MARWCERFSPLTAIDPPDGLWIDIAGCDHLFGGELALAGSVQQRLAPCRVAIADTAGAAWALARSTRHGDVAVIPPGEQAQAIAALPVSLLRISPAAAAGLHKLGLRSIENMFNVPRDELVARFGVEPLRQLDRALGKAAEPIQWQRPEQQWRIARNFAEPIATPEDLKKALAMLSEELCALLESKQMGGTSFRARFFRIDGGIAALGTATAAPLRKAAHLARLLGDRLDQVDPGLGVEAMVLEAEEVAAASGRQTDIAAQDHDETEDLAETVDLLANRLGAEQLWRPAPRASHIPERAFQPAPPRMAKKIWGNPPGRRPLRLLSPPEPVEAIALAPDDPPVLFRWRGVPHRIRAASLPERISTEWWRRSDSAELYRDYYRVEDEQGVRFWLFRSVLLGEARARQWYLHGLFG